MAAFLLVACAACVEEAQEFELVPEELIGVWRTVDDPRYEDRFFAITNAIVILGVGQSDRQLYAIERVQAVPYPRGTVYTIWYTSYPGVTPLKLTLDYSYGVVRLPNQRHLRWRKSQDRTS